jgi:hydrogenase maturation protease
MATATARDTATVGVIGVGNLLLCDEGVGVHAVRALAADAPGAGVVVVDGGTDPWASLSAVRGCRALLVLDAVAGGRVPGEFHCMALDDIDVASTAMSAHGLTLFHLLHYERLLGNAFEEVRVLGMEPDAVEPGMRLSERCSRRLPAFVDLVRAELRDMRQRLNAEPGGK